MYLDNEQLDVLAGHLAAEVLDRELEAVLRLLAERRRRPRQRVDEADADFVLRRRGVNHECTVPRQPLSGIQTPA